MDAFVADVLDLSLSSGAAAATAAAKFVEDGEFRADRLLASPLLRTNLAFHEGWRAVIGLAPTRVDFWDFVARQGPRALSACIVENTPVRVTAVLDAAEEAYARAFATLGASPKETRSALMRKLADRFCTDPAAALRAVQEMGLIQGYVALALEHGGRCLLDFEAWARSVAGEGVAAAPPTSIAEFYARSADVTRVLGLWTTDPISGSIYSIATPQPAQPAQLTCIEALRLAVVRDGYLWRKDAGGAIMVVPPKDEQETGRGVVPTSFGFRTVVAPWSVLSTAISATMYRRALVVGSSKETLRTPSNVADVVPVFTSWEEEKAEAEVEGGGGERRRLVACVTPPPPLGTSVGSHKFWVPLPAVDAPAPWASALHSAVLSAHALHAKEGGAGLFAYHQFVARYASARCLQARVFPGPVNQLGDVVMIDTRPNVWSLLSVLVTLDNLQAQRWGVTVVTGAGSVAFYERCLLPHVPEARILTVDELDGGGGGAPFDVEKYNALLKTPALWDRLMDRGEHVVMVQDDGMLVRPGLEEAGMLQYDYVGAPWIDVDANAGLKREVPTLVGNGGLSLRRVRTMRAISEAEGGKRGKRLFNRGMQPVPEDVFFAVEVFRRGGAGGGAGGGVAPTSVGSAFATEQIPVGAGQQQPLGFHKPWPYQKLEEVTALFDAALRDAALRSA